MNDKKINSALKQALENKETAAGGLPFNFTYRTMEKVQAEAIRKRKRQRLTTVIWFVAALLAIIALLIYVLFFYLEVELQPISMPKLSPISLPEKEVFGFYIYLGGVALFLLAIDFWLRNKRHKYRHH